MPLAVNAKTPEATLVAYARLGNHEAFTELVRRRQSWIRNLMRRFSGDVTLADDLAQLVFLQAWRTIAQLRQADTFGAWLKRLAVTQWLQHLRKHDVLLASDEYDDSLPSVSADTSVAMDLNSALAQLSETVRLCIVLSYHERMTHNDIVAVTDLPLGTVKSHIRRGTQQLQTLLSAYQPDSCAEQSP